ncbi:hypothetical protein OsI_13536 [Oryza sativa Indica Group]|nr:hypothetical protein OsI_13536 [Oryza sativa Indica Group]
MQEKNGGGDSCFCSSSSWRRRLPRSPRRPVSRGFAAPLGPAALLEVPLGKVATVEACPARAFPLLRRPLVRSRHRLLVRSCRRPSVGATSSTPTAPESAREEKRAARSTARRTAAASPASAAREESTTREEKGGEGEAKGRRSREGDLLRVGVGEEK